MPMDVCHILLGRLWNFDKGVMHDGKNNIYKLYKDGINHTLLPLQEEVTSKSSDSKALLLSRKEFFVWMEDNEVIFYLICKPKVILTSTFVTNFPFYIQYMLNDYSDIIVDGFPNELPLVKNISHHIELILGASLSNNFSYKMAPQENEEIKNQVHEMLDKELIREILSPCVVPTVLSHKKDGGWHMCTNSIGLNKITIRYKFPLPHIYDLLDCFSSASCFYKIDLNSGYHHIKIREGDEWKTTFKTNDGLYEWLVMPF